MSNGKKQYYGIKFPFTSNNDDYYFLDLNEKLEDKVASEIAHVILTPKRSRIRMPDFGTDLIKYVFEQNEDLTWDGVRSELTEAVSKYVNNVSINDVNIVESQEEHTLFLDVRYAVKRGLKEEDKRLVIKLI